MKKISKKYKKTIMISIASIIFVVFVTLGIIDSQGADHLLKDFKHFFQSNTVDDLYLDENVKIDNNQFTKAFVKRIVDGDTIVVTIDQQDYKVRLIGINTPESTKKIEEYGKEASNYTTKELYQKTIYLEKDVSQTDQYDRLLRYVWLALPDEINEEEIVNKLFNAQLLINGYAQIATYPPDVKYVDYFKKFHQQAREKQVGLWQLERYQ